MPLNNCHECGGTVSSAATACPHCGAPPLAAAATGVSVTTTQRTSKRLKIQVLMPAILMMVGAVGYFQAKSEPGGADPSAPMSLMMAGFLWLVVTKARIWWHHS